MSKEELNTEGLGVEEYMEAHAEEVETEVPEVEEAPARPSLDDRQARQEEKARKDGWRPYEEWDGDPDDWVSAEAFNERGKLLGKLKETQRETERRIENLNKIHQAQMEAERARILKERDKAFDEGDKDAFKNAEYQLQKLSEAPVTAPQVDPLIEEWNQKNPWINEQSAKSVYAKTLYAEAVQKGYSTAAILQHVNQGIAKEFGSPAPTSKPTQPEGERGSRPQGFGKQSSKKLTMADVRPEELKWRDAMPDAWKNDDEFLRAVADSRKV